GEPAPPASRLASAIDRSCARCHGGDGLGRGSPAFPPLAAQREAYLMNALEAYARGERHSGIMEPIAAGLEPALRRELAAHYSALPPGNSPAAPADPALVEQGRRIAQEGIPDRRVPACVECHGP